MSRMMRAVVEKWVGSTDIFIETDDAIELIEGLVLHGVEDKTDARSAISQWDNLETTDLNLSSLASERFLALISDLEHLEKVADEVVIAAELTVDPDDLRALLNNWHADRAEYQQAFTEQGSLILRLD